MVLTPRPVTTKYLILSAGILAAVLRATRYAVGVDEKGLLIRNHWTGIGVAILCAGVAALIILLTRTMSGQATGSRRSIPAGLGAMTAALAVALCPVAGPADPMSAAANLLRFPAALALIAVGLCRFTGKKPSFLLHCLFCLYLALRTVIQYRIWSADPQYQDYCFYLLAHLALMGTAYQFAALDAGYGHLRRSWIAGLAAVFLCFAGCVGTGDIPFPIGCALWALTNLASRPAREEP